LRAKGWIVSDRGTTVRFPPGARWACHGCGTCCRDFWELPATDEDVERISALPLEELGGGLGPDAPFEPVPGDPTRQGLRRIEGRCCFLDDQTRCRLHSEFGANAKPLPCREFPFLWVRAPDGVYAGMSFVCPSVIANQGAPIEEREAWARDCLGHPFAALSTPETIELTEGLALSWEEYALIEEGLTRLLGRKEIDLEDRLIAGSVWLGMLDLFLRQTRDETPVEPIEAIRHFSDSTERDGYERVLRIARAPAHSPTMHRMFLGMLIAFRNSLGVRQGRARVVGSILWNYLRHALRLGRIRLAPLDRTFAYRDFRRTTFDPRAEWAESLLSRYLTHMIFRKDLARRGEIRGGYHILLIAYAMIRWHAVALAAERGASEVGREDLERAVSLTEKHYGAHSRFLEMFDRYPVLSGIFYNVIRRKNFAHSLARWGF
jgi:Fe-S-cluster containining protein